jgi:flagellar FliL protein
MFGKKKKKDAAAETEAPADAPEGAEGEAAPKKKGKALILMIAAGVLVLGGGGAGAFVFLKPKPEAHAKDGEHGDKAHKPKKKKKKDDGHGKGDKAAAGAPVIKEGPDGEVFYTLPDIVVNIQSPDGRNTFLKLTLTLELPDHEAVEAIEPNTPRLNDMFTTFLRELRPEDLSGSQGTYQLRMEILRRVNLVAAPTEVKAVLIEEMLIQG